MASRVGRDQGKRTGLHFFQQELESRADRLFLQRIVESDRHDAIAGLRAKAYMRCQPNRSVVEHLFPINSLDHKPRHLPIKPCRVASGSRWVPFGLVASSWTA